MKYLKLTTAMLAVFSLSGCLGSGGDKVAETPPEEPPVVVEEVPATYIEKANSVNDMIFAIEDSELSDGLELPNIGSANYAGVMTLPDPSITDGILAGEFDVNVDFFDAEVSGNADNFSNSLDEVWSGSLDIAGTFDGVIDVDGTITSETGVKTIIDAEVDYIVALSSANAETPEYIGGTVSGLAWTGGDDEEFSGYDFVGQLQP